MAADKTVIVEIQYDTKDAIKNIDSLTHTLEEQRLTQSILKEEFKNGKISASQYSKEIETSKGIASKANAERRNTIKLLDSEKGSVNELKSQIKQLQTQNDKLNISTKEGSVEFKKNNDKIKQLQSTLKETKDATEKTGGAFFTLGKNLSSIPGPMGGIISGFGGMTKAALAFIATPVGWVIAAIVVALKALMSYFKGSEEGQNKLAKAMRAFGVVVGNLKDLLANLGELIIDQTVVWAAQFTKFFAKIGLGAAQVKGWFKDNTAAIKEQTAELAAAEKVLEDRQKQRAATAQELKDGIKNIVSETKKEIEIAKQLADRQAALEKLSRNFLVERAKLESKAADLKEQAEDKINNSLQKQLDLLLEADSLQKKIFDTELKIKKEKFELKKVQNSLMDSTTEDLDEQARLEADYILEFKANSDKKKELTAKISALQTALNAEIKGQGEASEEANKIDSSAQDAILKRRGEAIMKLAELKAAELEKEAETYSEQRDLAIENADAELIEKLAQKDIQDVEIELAEEEHKLRLEEIETKYQENIAAQRAKALQEQFQALDQIIAASENMADRRVTIGSAAFAKLATINFKEIKSASDAFLAIGTAAQGLTNLITANHGKELADLQSQKEAELSLVGDNAEAQAEISKRYAIKEQDLKKKQFEEDKKKAIIDASIATALAVLSGLTTQPFMPLGLAMAATAGVLGGIQIASIATKNYSPSASYAKGGIIGGQSHAQGGTKFWGQDGSMFEAEKGEAMFVLKKDATAEIAALSQLNESFGGRSFSTKSAHLAEGGEAQSINIESTVNDAIARTPIYVRVGDIETGMTETANTKQAGVI